MDQQCVELENKGVEDEFWEYSARATGCDNLQRLEERESSAPVTIRYLEIGTATGTTAIRSSFVYH
jgi:hypothetical protein